MTTTYYTNSANILFLTTLFIIKIIKKIVSYVNWINTRIVPFAVILSIIFIPSLGWTATIHVTNTNDSGPGSLRDAIATANWNGEADTIVFDVSGTITLTSGHLWIGHDDGTTIDASGQNIVIDASNVANAFQIASNNNAIKAGTESLKIQGAQQDGIYITGNSNVIDGIEVTGTSPSSTYYGAVTISGGDANEIKNCTIHNNDGYGIIVANGATNTKIHDNEIYENGHAHSGNFTPSGIIIEGDGTDGTTIENNNIYQNDGNGIYVLGEASSGPAHTTIQYNNIHDNSMSPFNGVGILIQGAVEGDVTTPSVHIYSNNIYGNYAQGVLIEAGNGGSPTYVKVDNNKIYSNGQEGVLIRDSGTDHNTVTANWIGFYQYSGYWPDPAPNGNSGVAIAYGAQYNDIDNNVIAYNQYQNVLISGSGTDHNTVRYNWILGGTYASPPVGYDNTGVIITDGARHNTIGPGNMIQYHKYDGIQIVGDGTDYNEVVDNGATEGGGISYNGRGIAVINEYPSPPDYDPQIGSAISGPAGTTIQNNDIMENYGDGIILRYIAPRSEGVTTISDNEITDNGAEGDDLGNGIYCIGSSPDITGNTITGNHENGIKLAVYFGENDSPSTANDDVLSDGTSMDISGNTIGDSGTVVANNNVGAGIYAVDTPLGDINDLYSDNTWDTDDDVCHIQQDWYGYVKVVDSDGNGITSETVIVEQGGNASSWVPKWTYTFTTYDANGNYGPVGFDIDHERTYQKIVEKRITNEGNLEDYTPQLVYIQGTDYKAEYAYNGKYPDPSYEIGGAIESPSGSGWNRYQYAQLTILSASPYAGKVVINEVLYRQTCGTSKADNDEFIELYFNEDVDISGWTISDGNVVNGDCDGGVPSCIGSFSFTFPAGSSFNAGDYVIVWVGSSDDTNGIKNAADAAAQFYVGKSVKLNNDGDDIWLFDDSDRLVDYMAYGSDHAINDQSYLPPGAWDGNNAPATCNAGQSLSLTPNGQDCNSGSCWEPTTSGDAPGPITRDTDDLSCGGNDRISSAGKNNNGIDFGDAPKSYGDAGSAVDSDIYMGAGMPDYEDSSQYSANADGDDTNNIDDEDGVASFPTLTTTTSSYSIRVNVTNNIGSNAYLRGWIDFDGNDNFDSDEASDLTTVSNGTSGSVTLTWSSIPNDITDGNTYVRLRLSSESLSENNATGIKGIGEVEDYNITIESAETTVSIIKEDNPDPVYCRKYLEYTINVTNTGKSTAKNVFVKDELDNNVTYISSSPAGIYYSSNHTLIWNIGDLNPSESRTFTINVSVKLVNNGTILHNHAIVSADNAYNETWQNTTVLGADFSIEKSDSLDPVAPNANLSYTINVTNTGYVNASVVVKDVLDPKVTYISSDPSGSYYSSNNTVVWNIQLNVSESKIITLNVKVKDVANGTVLSNYVNVSLNGIKYAEDTEQTTVNEPKIAITKIDNPDPVYAGKLLNYAIVIENIGSTKAENVFVKDELDNNVTYISSSPAGIYYSSNHTLIWNINSLNVSKSKILNISVLVKNTVPNGTIINNSAIVSLPGFYNETNQSTTVLAAEIYDPKTAIDLNGPPLQPGDVLEYSIWLNNTGILDTIAKFVDPIPEHTTYANYVWASSGSVLYNELNNSIEWHGNIPAGSYVNVRFRVKIDAPLPDNTIISNQGTVYYDSNNDGIIDAEKPTDDPTTNQPYDPTNVTVKNPEITLTKTATTADYGKNVTFTIKLCVEGYATNITLVEHYPSKLRFIEANPKPTEGNNIWKFKKLQDECIEIKITMHVPAYYYEFEMSGSVKGKGIVLNNKKFYTGIKPTTIVNRVSLTCDQGIKKEAAVKVTIREKRGNFAAIHERGIGNYSSEESIKVKRRIIYIKKSVNANSTDSNFGINYCFQNKYGDYIKKRLYGKSMEDFTKAKSSTPRMESETTINGTYTVKVKSDFRMNETYNGNYNIYEKIDGNADVNVKGRGLGIFEEESAYHRMFERGMGNYESKTKFNEPSFEKKTNATNFLQKVCYFNNGNYISTTTEGNFSNNVKAYSLLNYSLNSQLNGSLKFKMDALAKVDEWYAGKFTVHKEISMAYLTPWIPDGIISKGEYENKTAFDGFEIYWKSDEKYLYMALKANTTGWLRIGFAICSCFNPAYDYIAGFVVNNKTKVLDMYYNGTLMLDKNTCGDFGCCKQSISKFGGKERGNCTTIEFKRKLDTKDAYDAKLVKGKKVKIVWAVGKDDDVWSEDVRSGEGEIVI